MPYIAINTAQKLSAAQMEFDNWGFGGTLIS